jgi:long-chain acyl-CoA synthetase
VPYMDAPATLCEAFQESAARRPDAVALRAFGTDTAITWREYADRVRRIAAGLTELGVGPGDTVALMMANRPEFHLVDTAAIHLGAVPFSIYNTSSAAQVAYVLENSGARVAVVDDARREIVRSCGVPVKVVQTDSLERSAGRDDFEETWRRVRPDDLLTIIYTSGTTGPPKGVELTHANLLAQAEAVAAVVDLHEGDIGLSYLPAAHIADRLASHYVQMLYGADITCLDDLGRLGDALAHVRPTYWATVPRVLEKMRARIEDTVAGSSRPKRLLWQAAHLYPHGLADTLVFSKLRARLGLDRARWVLCGAAPLPVPVLRYFLDLGLPVLELWGMSETSGVGTINPPGRARPGTVGLPVPGISVRVADDGELLIRGPIVTRGYRGIPGPVVDADGYFATGDLATVDDEGYVKIVDRKKELIINAAGKNMSPAAIEGALKSSCPLISHAVVIGDGRPYNVALLVLDPESVAALLAREPGADIAAVVEAGVAAGNEELSRVEQIKRYAILDDPWEPGGDELTPTLKLRRAAISAKYADVISGLY